MSKIQNSDVKGQSDVTANSRLINTNKIYVTKTAEILDDHLRKNNMAASAAPTATDDSGSGYEPGSVWVDTTNDKAYVCLDATAAAAVWIETTQSGSGLTVQEVDASPSVSASTLIFPNGTLTDNGGGSVTYTPAGGGGGSTDVTVLKDEQDPSAEGGSSAAGVNVRRLNTQENAVSWCSLVSNQWTLDAGEYVMIAVAPAYRTASHRLWIANVTDSTDSKGPLIRHSGAGNEDITPGVVHAYVNIGASKTYQLEHYFSNAKVNDGLGVGSVGITGDTVPRVYAMVTIIKIA